MHQWLYTLRIRLTLIDRSFLDGYRVFSGFAHVSEVVTLDSIICPDLIDELRAEDWKHNVPEDFRTRLFRDVQYLLNRQLLNQSQHQLLAALENPDAEATLPDGFTRCGHDIMDSCLGNSTLTNSGPIPKAFSPSEVNDFGLIDDRDRAFAIRDAMRSLEPDDPHLEHCEVWLLARRLPDKR